MERTLEKPFPEFCLILRFYQVFFSLISIRVNNVEVLVEVHDGILEAANYQ